MPSLRRSEQLYSSKPVLVIQHAPHEHAGILKRALETQGIPVIIVHSYRRKTFPKLTEVRGIVALGGPMGANDTDKHPWIEPECQFLKQAADANYPVVGICLGAQMLARALGAEVSRNKVSEVGWFPIALTQEGKRDAVLGSAGVQPTVYHWHNDTFALPEGATLLAASAACERQAYRIRDKIYGFQFHPEADHQLVHQWLGIHGVEAEILKMRGKAGHESVQEPEAQRFQALYGETASVRITAAIGQLFQQKEYEKMEAAVYDQYEAWATLRTPLIVEIAGADGKPLQVKGEIASLCPLAEGEFLVLRDEKTMLWPIRLDHVLSAMPALK